MHFEVIDSKNFGVQAPLLYELQFLLPGSSLFLLLTVVS